MHGNFICNAFIVCYTFFMKRILCFGDSNTWGYIPLGGLKRYPENERWTSLLQQKLGSDYTVVEFGLCGCEASGKNKVMGFNADGRTLFPPVLFASLPVDVVIIMLGTNDTNRLNDWKRGNTAAGLKEMIQTARMFCPNVKIVLAAPVQLDERIAQDVKFSIDAVENSRLCAEEVESLAREENTLFFDTNAFVHVLGADGCHFTKENHAAFADGLFDFLNEHI